MTVVVEGEASRRYYRVTAAAGERSPVWAEPMGLISYLDLDLLVEASGELYRARVLDSPVGQATHDFSLPFTPDELQALFLQVYQVTSAPPSATLRAAAMEGARSFGGRLHGALFDGRVSACVLRSLDEAERSGKGLRIRLRLADQSLAAIPWEFLYDEATGSFLCLSDQTPVIRYVELPERIEPVSAQPPLTMLGVIATPAGAPTLSVEEEWGKLEEALRGPKQEGRIVLERLEPPTVEELQRRLQEGEIHIVHFIGHGGFSDAVKEGLLLLQDAAGRPAPVAADQLGVLLHDHSSLRLVVLNACEGARQAGADPFAGVAQSLVRSGIPAVIGMQFQISDRAAITFAGEFYSAVADGFPVDAALAEARKAVFTRDSPIEWATPVLFMRAPDGRIFDIGDQEERLKLRAETGPQALVETPKEAAPRRQRRRAIALAGVAMVAVVGALVLWRSFGGNGETHPGAGKGTVPLVGQAAPSGSLRWTPTGPLPSAGPGTEWAQKVLDESGRIVAVGSVSGKGYDAAVWTWVDGSGWTLARGASPETFRLLGDQTIFGISHGPPGYVAVGYTNGPDGYDAAVWTSADGSVWTKETSPVLGGPGKQEMHRVLWSEDRFVAVGYSGSHAAVWSSPDGHTWTVAQVGSGVSAWMRGVAAEAGMLFAVGSRDAGRAFRPAAWRSTDGGKGWEDLSDQFTSGTSLAAVAAGQSGLVAVGYDHSGGRNRAAVWFSSDGLNWSRAGPDQAAFSSSSAQELLDVVANGDTYLAVGYDGGRAAVWSSRDGKAWVKKSSIPGPTRAFFQGIAVTPRGLVAVGEIDSAEGRGAGAWRAANPTPSPQS